MRILLEWIRRSVGAIGRGRTDADLQEELRLHAELAREEGKVTPSAASAMDSLRDQRSLPWIDDLRRDVLYALRTLPRTPAFTVVAIGILALGIGVNTAMFSIVRPLLIQPLPFRDSDQLVWVSPHFTDGRTVGTYPAPVFQELRDRARSYADLTAYFAFFDYSTYTLTGSGPAEGIAGVSVAARFFETLGVEPAAGRLFTPDESEPKGQAALPPTVAVISHGLWQRRFAADPRLVGTAITINDSPVTVVGVLPPDFDFGSVFAPTTNVDLFLPAPLEAMRDWGSTLSIVGRLRAGTPIETARAEVDGLLPELRESHPEWGQVTAVVTDLRTSIARRFRSSLMLLWLSVGLVLVIACANLSSLLLARTASRTREFAIRAAVGAGRSRVVRQLLTEGVVLALCGAASGIPLAYGITSYVKSRAMLALPLLNRADVDGAVLLFGALAALLAGLSFMVMPALRVPGHQLREVLAHEAWAGRVGTAAAMVRSMLLVAEIGLTSMLLVGASLLIGSLLHVLNVDLGFESSRAAVIRLNVPLDSAPDARARRRAVLAEVTDRVGVVPGIEAAGVTDALPLDRNRGWTLRVPGQVYPPNETPVAFAYVTGPGYLRAMGIRLRTGRDFSAQDLSDGQPVAILNDRLAGQLWPGQSALGRTILTNGRVAYTVVGVVDDVRQASLEEAPVSQIYVPYTYASPGALDLIVRSSRSAASLAPDVRTALSSINPDLMLAIRPVDDLVDRAVSPRRFLAVLMGAFSLLALLLACLGIYGVVSYEVSQRVREIGVRMALGASRGEIRTAILRDAARVAAIGVALGTGAAAGLSRLITSLLYQTAPLDPAAFALAVGIVMVVAVAAALAPAVRASRVDPMTALRAQ